MAEIKKTHITEIKSLASPPVLVKDVMTVVMLLFGYTDKQSQDWKQAKRFLAATDDVLKKLRDFDASKVPPETAQKVKAVLDNMELDNVRKVSFAASSLWMWANTVVSRQS